MHLGMPQWSVTGDCRECVSTAVPNGPVSTWNTHSLQICGSLLCSENWEVWQALWLTMSTPASFPWGHNLEDAVVHWEPAWCWRTLVPFKTDGRVPVPLGLHRSKPVSLSPHPVWLGLSLASGLLSKMRRALCYKLHVSSIFERTYKLFIVCPAVCIHSSFTFTHWTAAAKLAGFFVFKDYFMCLGVLLAGISVFYVCEWCIHIGCWIY